MARICIFDTKATQNSDGSNRLGGISTDVGEPRNTNPFRLFGGIMEQDYVTYEFLVNIRPGFVAALRWWQEFYNDTPALSAAPTLRSWPDVDANSAGNRTPWMRECDAIIGALGRVDHYAILRYLDLAPRGGIYLWANSYYVPLSVRALWCRLALYVDLAASTGIVAGNVGDADTFRLRVFAHVGGHDERQYLYENGDKPYAYNAYK